MKRQGTAPPRRGWRRAALILGAALLAALAIATVAGAQGDGEDPAGDLPLDPQWLANTITRGATTTSVTNNASPETIKRRDDATAAWKQAVADAKAKKRKPPSPLAKPEYLVVWSA